MNKNMTQIKLGEKSVYTKNKHLQSQRHNLENFYDGWRMIPLKDNTCTFIDINGRPLMARFGKKTCDFLLGMAKVELLDGTFTFINNDGQIMNERFKKVLPFLDQDWAWVELLNGNTTFVNRNGQLYGQEFQDSEEEEKCFIDGWAKVRLEDGLFTLINREKEMLGKRFKYLGRMYKVVTEVTRENGKKSTLISEADYSREDDIQRDVERGYKPKELAIQDKQVINKVVARVHLPNPTYRIYVDTNGQLYDNSKLNFVKIKEESIPELESEIR